MKKNNKYYYIGSGEPVPCFYLGYEVNHWGNKCGGYAFEYMDGILIESLELIYDTLEKARWACNPFSVGSTVWYNDGISKPVEGIFEGFKDGKYWITIKYPSKNFRLFVKLEHLSDDLDRRR